MQNRSSLLLAALFGLVVAATACGGGSGATGDGGGLSGGDAGTPAQISGVPGTKTLSTINADDIKKICDWTASLYGGYGGQTVCNDSPGITETITGPTSQAECLGKASIIKAGCTTTVSQMESCLRSISTCGTTGDATPSADCMALFACYTTGP